MDITAILQTPPEISFCYGLAPVLWLLPVLQPLLIVLYAAVGVDIGGGTVQGVGEVINFDVM